MKTYRIFGILIATGKKKELDEIAKLEGDYHVHKNPARNRWTAAGLNKAMHNASGIREEKDEA